MVPQLKFLEATQLQGISPAASSCASGDGSVIHDLRWITSRQAPTSRQRLLFLCDKGRLRAAEVLVLGFGFTILKATELFPFGRGGPEMILL